MSANDQPATNGPQTVSHNLAIVLGDLTLSALSPVKAGQLEQDFLRRVDVLARSHGGRILKFMGDGFLAVFEGDGAADKAVAFAIATQQSSIQHPLDVGGEPLRVRLSVHLGPIELRKTGYGEDAFGAAVIYLVRLGNQVRDREIVVSAAARAGLRSAELLALLGPEESAPAKEGEVRFSRVNAVEAGVAQ